MSEATQLLNAMENGDPQAARKLFPLIYDELRRMAAHWLAQEKPGQTLQPTALVHEAYVRLVDTEKVQRWNSRRHFFAAAAEAMRRILIDRAREKQADKHGGKRRRVDFEQAEAVTDSPPEALLALNEALERLGEKDRTAFDLVKLRYFA